MKIIMTKGLPGSGKSTWAIDKLKANQGWKRINKDDLRAMIDDSRWSKGNEKFILKARDALIEQALSHGHTVIVDDTNLHEKHAERLREMAAMHGADFEIQDFTNVPLETCIENDLKRDRSVGERVIRNMHRQFLEKKPVPYNGEGLPKCIIVDIDGTLALKKDRSPYDWHRVGEDDPHRAIIHLVQMISLHDMTLDVILFSGRDAVCRDQTEEWLLRHEIRYRALHMRPEGNCEKDSIIKERLFDEHIRGKYKVLFVLDDRNQVVEMWRRLGLTCLQVAEGDF